MLNYKFALVFFFRFHIFFLMFGPTQFALANWGWPLYIHVLYFFFNWKSNSTIHAKPFLSHNCALHIYIWKFITKLIANLYSNRTCNSLKNNVVLKHDMLKNNIFCFGQFSPIRYCSGEPGLALVDSISSSYVYFSLARVLLVFKVVSVCQAWADQFHMKELWPGKCWMKKKMRIASALCL